MLPSNSVQSWHVFSFLRNRNGVIDHVTVKVTSTGGASINETTRTIITIVMHI